MAALCARANTAAEVLAAARSRSFPLADRVAELARDEAAGICAGAAEIEVLIFDREGVLAGRSDG